MTTTFDQFHKLPPNLKQAVTSPEAVQKLETLEEKYSIPLSDIILQLMVRELPFAQLGDHLRDTLHMTGGSADALIQELKSDVLRPVVPYLTGPSSAPALQAQTQARVPTSQEEITKKVNTPSAVPASPMSPLQPLSGPVTTQPVVPLAPSTSRPLPAASRASFFLNAEDEEDIAMHKDRLQRIAGEPTELELDADVDAVVERFRITFTNDELARRFRAVTLSGLRGIRDGVALNEAFTRPVIVGGLGLDTTIASQLAKAIRDEADRLHTRQAPLPKPAQAPVSAQPIPHIAPPPPVPVPPQPLSTPLPPRPQPYVPAAPSAPMPIPSMRRPRPMPQEDRNMIQDIKHPYSHPMGPADELANLTLDEFRSLGGSMQEAAEKILERIHLLAEESFVKRAEGVTGWRKSEVYRTYLAMGQQSMAQDKTIEQVSAERQRLGTPMLTSQEFSIVADLNKQMTL